MSLTIDRFLRVSLVDSPTSAQEQDQSIACYATDQYSDQFIDNLYLWVSSQVEVEQIFGTDSEIARATAAAFSHPMKPRQAMIAYWNKTGQAVIARANALIGTRTPVSFANLASSYTFEIKSRNVTEVGVYAKDVGVTDYDTFVTQLNESLPDTTRFVFAYADGVFSLSSKVAGSDVDTDNIELIGNIADDLRLTINLGVKQVRGLNASTPVAQTATDLISSLDDKQPNYFGFYCATATTDTDIEEFHDRLLSGSRKRVFAYTALADYMLDYDQSNPLYRIASKNSRIMLCQLNKLGQKHAAVQLLVEACSTDWNARNTAKTMKFKREPLVQSDSGITTTIANKADRLGINYYTDYDGLTMLAEGRTVGTEVFFIDSTTGRFALVSACQAAVATRLVQLPKVPQTDEGQVILENALVSVMERFVNNGFLGKNLVWNNIGFGEINTGDVLPLGWYMFSDSYQLQSQSDRELRKAMPIQIAAKESGAVHDADILIYVER